jgi:Tfp pilus assembly protein PilF
MNKSSNAFDMGPVREIFGLFNRGEFPEALKLARNFHAKHPSLAIANYCVGHALAANKTVYAAIPYLKAAADLAPDNADYLVRYGRVLLDAGRIVEAEDILVRAHKINPKLTIALLTLGIFYSSIQRFDQSEKYFKEVLESKPPAEVFELAELNWIKSLVEIGSFDQAQSLLRNRIERGAHGIAHLALFVEIGSSLLDSPEHRMIDKELSKGELKSQERATLLRAKAKMAKRSGRTDESFSLIKESKKAVSANFDQNPFSKYVDQTVSNFDKRTLERLQEKFGRSSFEPIYIVGLPRSGTTLTERIVASHREVGGAGELSLLGNFRKDILKGRPVDQFENCLLASSHADIDELVNGIERNMRHLCPGKDRIADKMPGNFMNSHLVKIFFPKARIIHCYRHPADNFLSGFEAELNSTHSYFDSPDVFAGYFESYLRLMRHWYSVMPDLIFSLRYEDLVSESRSTIGKLLDFCGLDWDENCMSPEKNSTRIATASMMQARNPINAESVGRWKRHFQELRIIDERLGAKFDNFSPARP